MLINIVKSNRFSLFILAMALAAGGMWFLRPQLGWLPLVIALAPWILKAAVDTFPYQPSLLDIPMALFLATAAGGLWLSYDMEAAQTKYWLIIGAVIIYYAMALQPWKNLWKWAGFLTLLGVFIGFYFLMTHDWQAQPAKIAFINELGLRWMSLRPALGIDTIHPNVTAGLAAIAFPFPLAFFRRGFGSTYRGRRKYFVFIFSVVCVVFLLFILLVTTSRGAWLALGAALLFWIVWEGSSHIGERSRQSPRIIFGLVFFSLAMFGLYIVLTYPGGPVALINRLPGPSNVDSRAELIRDTLFLIGDFSLTGSGLSSFPGLYANYSLVLPTYVLGHSHNIFLDITLEQGPLGIVAFLGVWGGTLWLLIRPKSRKRRVRRLSLLSKAVVSSLLVLILHGLVDDPFYGSRAILFLFLLPGMATAIFRAQNKDAEENTDKRPWVSISRRAYVIGTGLIVLSSLLTVIVFQDKLISDWYANLGALEMARVELVDWPTDQWDDGRNAASLALAAGLFNQSLSFNPLNETAHHRLGLIAMLNRNYEEAIGHLEAAYQVTPSHQGIQKTLGYSYVWVGDFEKAIASLRAIRESRQELGIYISWWNGQGRPDLSNNAAVMVQRLEPVN